MTVLEKTDLKNQILHVLRVKGKALRILEIEVELKNEGHWLADTFDVRDAVSTLIDAGEVEVVHPGRLVKLAQR